MKEKIIRVFDFIVYWSAAILPFSVAIAPGLANTFIGFMVFGFMAKKILQRENSFIKTPINSVRNRSLQNDYNPDKIVSNRVGQAFLILLFFSLLSLINSVDLESSFHGLIKWLKYFLLFTICGQEIKDIRHIKRIITSIALAVSLIGADVIWQLKFGKDFIRGNSLDTCVINLFRPTASFPNSNILAVYLTALTPLLAGLAIFYYRGREKIPILCATSLAVAGIILTLSRGAGLGLFVALSFLAIARKDKIMIIILIASLLIYPLIMPKNIKKWAKEINYNPLVFMCNYDRISTYKNTLNMIAHHPFIGVGVNTFSKNYLKYKLREEGAYKTGDNIYAHNIYLHIAGEMGLLGLVGFIYFLFVLFKQGLASCRRYENKYLKIISLGLLVSL